MAVVAEPADLHMQPPRRIDEAEALRISNRIDEQLKAEKELLRRKKTQNRDVKVMLIGQAESGKSTLQKQFQLYYASQTLDKERPAWRPVVHFNIIKAIRMIIEELDYDFTQPLTSPIPSRSASVSPPRGSTSKPSRLHHQHLTPHPELPNATKNDLPPNGEGSSSAHGPLTPIAESNAFTNTDGWSEDLLQLRAKLLPLVVIEETLARDLSGGVTVSGGRIGVFVRSGWQSLLSSAQSAAKGLVRGYPHTQPGSPGSAMNDLAAKLICTLRDEILTLWRHDSVFSLVQARKLRLEECASFFLENIHRIAEPDYMPSTEDILNVRLQTLGVTEHSFDINLSGTQVNWLLYDVGGARGQRHAWVPYFDDATAIIFLAPISAFDQYLEEDPRTNRIDDSLQLFTTICSNKLLKNTHLVLMLNKTDLLKQKITAGIKVRKYITSYGDRPNNYPEISEYFRAHFLQVHRRNDVSKRALYTHFTSMLDIKATQKIIVDVGEAIIRSYIANAGLT